MTSLEERLGYEFKDRTLLETALTHTSWANEHGLTHKDSNERLEFLGDSVLSHIVAHKLYNEHDAYSEGELTRTRAALVCESSLSRIRKADRTRCRHKARQGAKQSPEEGTRPPS